MMVMVVVMMMMMMMMMMNFVDFSNCLIYPIEDDFRSH
jgi:hypothetical protein